MKTNNYKDYAESTVEKIEMIKSAKEGGFALSEIKNLLENCYNKHISANKKVEIVNTKINEIDSKILYLQNVRKLLSECIDAIEYGGC